MQMTFQRHFSGAPWESKVGYCRALRAGSRIFVTGTAPVNPDGSVHAPGDAYAQTKRCLTIITEALSALGAGIEHVTRTRIFVTDISRWQEYGRAHGDVFCEHPPATTMVEIPRLIHPDMMVEIEADAVVGVD
jgi:isochorismate pyruvate lyase